MSELADPAANAYGLSRVDQLPIESGAEQWYSYSADSYIAQALEVCWEWDYADNRHTYCHDRSVLVGLLREIERLRSAGSVGYGRPDEH